MRKTLLVGLMLSPSVYAADGPHEHRGFYLRMHLGPAYFHGSSGDADTTIKGPGATLGVAVGAALAENFMLYGEFFDDIAMEPTIEVGNASGTLDEGSSGLSGAGAGMAYYVMPLNLYVALGIHTTTILVQEDPDKDPRRTTYGIGGNVMVGKEWWVSPNWGLGVAGQFAAGGLMKDKADNSYSAVAGGVVFSATYN